MRHNRVKTVLAQLIGKFSGGGKNIALGMLLTMDVVNEIRT